MPNTKPKANTTLRNSNLFCLNCGGEFKLSYPIEIDSLNKKIKAFNLLHKNCKPTWQEPEADHSKSVKERAEWWFKEGERGRSSETIWFFMMGSNNNTRIDHPLDPSDFHRCYKLLKALPEWKKDLHKLKGLSPAWSRLIDNWEKLTALLEDNIKTKKDNGMYKFMQTIMNQPYKG